MSSTTDNVDADGADDHVDDEIAGCLNLDAPRSFFLFAGAGSGKTRSLVTALHHVQKNLGERLRVKGQRVGVITFTNAACDEIKRRIMFDSLVDVRTIHSFSWSLIEGLNRDIRSWLYSELRGDIEQLNADEVKGRKGTKASASRLSKIESKTRRLKELPNIKSFTYSPTGDNRGRDALNHSEVLQLTAHFLQTKKAMQSILACRYPILLIDESQDTNKNLIDALFAVQAALKEKFVLGLLGDMMQRIYSDGKEGLGQDLPQDWATPGKKLNHRCPKRIVALINKVRSTTDKQHQESRAGAPAGLVRLFILPNDQMKKPKIESSIAAHMSNVTGDEQWNEPKAIKTLILEHRMAAARMGFLEAFSALYDVDSWRTSFLEGALPAFRFFSEQVLPLVKAKRNDDRFAVARIVKSFSPILAPAALQHSEDKQRHLHQANAAIGALMALWEGDVDPTLLDILQCVAGHNLFEIPDSLRADASGAIEKAAANATKDDGEKDAQAEMAGAIEKFLSAPFSQIEPMIEYLSGRAHFDTHQGVKGLEFDRVMVIMDDSEAGGFMFKYEDLFGGKPAGNRTVEGTRRLFYVTSSRAKESLALVAYSAAPERVRKFVLDEGWFSADEVVVGESGLSTLHSVGAAK
ncbi:ATP-dependent helicase [Corallococcus exiguus]|uniref:UvrD-helicase domain-containing protein n=1 Tax=Corallococcus TaxID=83461 RepID=UPI000F87619F|nr:UvrD-helicase domain-containing protein [Corallococcus sp. AB018]NRD55682.1 ATP-dependent helicase [Corallococcus exiguus]NRD67189.1 ATP-dependent helicase [Corallococcus exiguus]RUO92891.1 ATP-dependent helicase [Corallococcus sp. AB018]